MRIVYSMEHNGQSYLEISAEGPEDDAEIVNLAVLAFVRRREMLGGNDPLYPGVINDLEQWVMEARGG